MRSRRTTNRRLYLSVIALLVGCAGGSENLGERGVLVQELSAAGFDQIPLPFAPALQPGTVILSRTIDRESPPSHVCSAREIIKIPTESRPFPLSQSATETLAATLDRQAKASTDILHFLKFDLESTWVLDGGKFSGLTRLDIPDFVIRKQLGGATRSCTAAIQNALANGQRVYFVASVAYSVSSYRLEPKLSTAVAIERFERRFSETFDPGLSYLPSIEPELGRTLRRINPPPDIDIRSIPPGSRLLYEIQVSSPIAYRLRELTVEDIPLDRN